MALRLVSFLYPKNLVEIFELKYNYLMDDYYDLDELDEVFDGDDELEGEKAYDEDDDFDDYDDYDFDEDDDEEDELIKNKMDDNDVEWAGIADGEEDAKLGFPMSMGPLYDDLSDEQRDLYEMGYYNGYNMFHHDDEDI